MSQGQRQDHNRQSTWVWVLAGVGGVLSYIAVVIVLSQLLGLESQAALSILIVPGALAGVGYVFTWWQKSRDLAVEEQRLRNAQELEQQRAQDEVFQAYLDQLAEPLISGQLHKAGRFDSVRVLARARTVGVLWKLDSNRKRSLVQFLHEAKLIRREELDREGEESVNPVIGLSGADLRDGYLRWLNLSKADLKGADLKRTNLRDAGLRSADLRGADLEDGDLRDALLGKAEDLEGADLDGADLRGANLKGVDLSGADLEGALLDDGQLDECKSLAGTTMTDGQKYEEWLKGKEGR
jgi:hypothetical protein